MTTSSVFLAKRGLFPDLFNSSEGSSVGINATRNEKKTLSIVFRASKPKEVNHLRTAPFLDIWRHFITMATVTPRRQPTGATLSCHGVHQEVLRVVGANHVLGAHERLLLCVQYLHLPWAPVFIGYSSYASNDRDETRPWSMLQSNGGMAQR